MIKKQYGLTKLFLGSFNMKNLILCFSILIILISCNTTSPEEFDKQSIIEILDSIQSNFNFDDLDGIMQYYHEDFYHDGDDFEWERNTVWFTRLNDFDILDIESIEIEVRGDFATASFIMSLDQTVTDEPSVENGDISWFYYDQQNWLVCGEDFILDP